MISHPTASIPKNHPTYQGYLSNIEVDRLSGVTGYTAIADIHYTNMGGATVTELRELDKILKGGVIL